MIFNPPPPPILRTWRDGPCPLLLIADTSERTAFIPFPPYSSFLHILTLPLPRAHICPCGNTTLEYHARTYVCEIIKFISRRAWLTKSKSLYVAWRLGNWLSECRACEVLHGDYGGLIFYKIAKHQQPSTRFRPVIPLHFGIGQYYKFDSQGLKRNLWSRFIMVLRCSIWKHYAFHSILHFSYHTPCWEVTHITLYWRGHQARLSGKVFWDVHGQTSRDLNHEAGLNIILYSDWL